MRRARELRWAALTILMVGCGAESTIPTSTSPNAQVITAVDNTEPERDELSSRFDVEKGDRVSAIFLGENSAGINDAALALAISVLPSDADLLNDELALANVTNRLLQSENAIDSEQIDPLPDRAAVDFARPADTINIRDVAVLLGAAVSDASNINELRGPTNRLLPNGRQLSEADILRFPGPGSSPSPTPMPSPSASPMGDIQISLPEAFEVNRGATVLIPIFIENNPGGLSLIETEIQFDTPIFDNALPIFTPSFGSILRGAVENSSQNSQNLQPDDCGCSLTTLVRLREEVVEARDGRMWEYNLEVDPNAPTGEVPLRLTATVIEGDNELTVVTRNGSVVVR